MKNTVAVAIGLRYRFHDFEVGTILQNEDDFYIKTTGKYPLVNLATGESLHYALVEKMEFALLNMGSRLTITSTVSARAPPGPSALDVPAGSSRGVTRLEKQSQSG